MIANLKHVCRYLFFRIVIATVSVLIVWVICFLFRWDYDRWTVLIAILGSLAFWPRGNIVWRRIVKLYGKTTPLNGKLLSTAGSLIDEQEGSEESIILLTSIIDEGLVLYRPHIIGYLRESAVIPWDDLKILKIRNVGKATESELQDQVENLEAEISIVGIRPRLKIPWTKEMELYSNIIQYNHETTANKSSKKDAASGTSS